jgi:hypothetical protein
MSRLSKAALAYQGLGWSVIPIKPSDKIALIKWGEFQNRKASIIEIGRWWTRTPNANVGVVTGNISGIIAIDIDSIEVERVFRKKFGKEFFETVSQRTGKAAAQHLIFKHPGDKKYRNFSGLLEGVDVRADGGYIVMPPSAHPNGKLYSWIIPPQEGHNNMMNLPENLKNALQARNSIPGRSSNEEGWLEDALLGAHEGHRNDTCAKLAGYYLRRFNGDVKKTKRILHSWNYRNIPPLETWEVDIVISSVSRIRRGAGGR